VPFTDPDPVPSVQVEVDGVPVPTALFGYRWDQLQRFGFAVDQESGSADASVMWWADLTDHLGGTAAHIIAIQLPALSAGQFLGPFLQVPAHLAPTFSAPAAVMVEPTAPDGRVRVATATGPQPRLLEARLDPVAIASGTGFTVTAVTADADQVFVSLDVGGSGGFDRRLEPVAGEPGRWRLAAQLGERTSMIIYPRELVLWCERGLVRSPDLRIPIQWTADAV
jgi:hypothetical protein